MKREAERAMLAARSNRSWAARGEHVGDLHPDGEHRDQPDVRGADKYPAPTTDR